MEQENKKEHTNGWLVALFIILISAASVLAPVGLMCLFKIKFSIMNYIYTALSSTAIMLLVMIIDTRYKNPKNDENSQQSN